METKYFSDYELVNQFISGNCTSLEKLINRYRKKVYTYILMMVKNHQVAEDLFQDTFFKVINSLKENKYQENGKFLPWVMRIAHNLIIDFFRKEKKLNILSNDDYEADLFNTKNLAQFPVEELMVKTQAIKEIRSLLDELPFNQREVIILRHYMGMSFKEIASHTNVSINTSLGRMRYALLNLKKLIKEKNICILL